MDFGVVAMGKQVDLGLLVFRRAYGAWLWDSRQSGPALGLAIGAGIGTGFQGPVLGAGLIGAVFWGLWL